MTITAAEILSTVNEELGLALTSINRQLIKVVQELAEGQVFLPAVATVATVAATETVADAFQTIESIQIAGYAPLEELSLAEVHRRNQSIAPAGGRPRHFARFNSLLYLAPVPDAVYTLNINGFTRHGASATVAYPDRFKALLEAGCCREAARRAKEWEQLAVWEREFERLKDLHSKTSRNTIRRTRYQDI
jgi:hypothetical protein